MATLRIFWLLMTVLLTPSTAQSVYDYDTDLINLVFNMQNEVIVPTTGRTLQTNQDGEECICVPYYLCDDNEKKQPDYSFIINVRIQKETCQSSVEVCCPTSNILTAPKIIPDNIKEPGCGIRNANGLGFKVTGNPKTDSQFGEFPWTVTILKVADGIAVCGGSLIHPKVVLTAAHCVHDYQRRQLKVRAGEWDTQTTKEPIPHQERTINSVIEHPRYKRINLANDISIMFLDNAFDRANHIKTVCLPSPGENFENKKNCIATGWGKTSYNLEARYAVLMKKVEMDIEYHHTCELTFKNTRLGQMFTLDSSFICAGGAPGKDTCEGDGGGPLVCSSYNGRYYLAGITSWGIGCYDNLPGVYVNVSRFRDWIDSLMAAAGLDSLSYIP